LRIGEDVVGPVKHSAQRLPPQELAAARINYRGDALLPDKRLPSRDSRVGCVRHWRRLGNRFLAGSSVIRGGTRRELSLLRYILFVMTFVIV
jgi:hypothetical protein